MSIPLASHPPHGTGETARLYEELRRMEEEVVMKDLEEDFTPLVDERGEDRRWEVWEPPTEFPDNRVWTIVVYDNDDDSSTWYAMPGYHRVNREYFIVTEEPWTDPDKDYLY